MASLFTKTFPVGPNWAFIHGQPEYLLQLDVYELRHLRDLMEMIYTNNTAILADMNTGDWVGQIRHALVEGFRDG